MNKRMLKSKMALFGDTNATLANVIGISPQRFSAKINGTDGADFTREEMRIIKERYSLSAEEIENIFFAELVS